MSKFDWRFLFQWLCQRWVSVELIIAQPVPRVPHHLALTDREYCCVIREMPNSRSANAPSSLIARAGQVGSGTWVPRSKAASK